MQGGEGFFGTALHPPRREATEVTLLRNTQGASSDQSARAYGRRAEALAEEDPLRRVPPKTQEGPRLHVLRSRLLRSKDQAGRLYT